VRHLCRTAANVVSGSNETAPHVFRVKAKQPSKSTSASVLPDVSFNSFAIDLAEFYNSREKFRVSGTSQALCFSHLFRRNTEMIKRYVVVFLTFAITIACTPFLLDLLGRSRGEIDWAFAPIAGLIATLCSGFLILMNVFSLSGRLREHRSSLTISDRIQVDSVNLLQKTVLGAARDEAFQLCRKAITYVDNARLFEDNASNMSLRARTGFSMSSFGEHIEIRLNPIGDRFTEVEIRSRPSIRTTLLDNGKNLSNITNICVSLRRHSNSLHIGELVSL
jgi:hypothetical protein